MLAGAEALVSPKELVLSYGGRCVICILRATEDRLCDGEAVALAEWSHVPNLGRDVRKDERREKRSKEISTVAFVFALLPKFACGLSEMR